MATDLTSLTAERLRALVDYNRETGQFSWRVDRPKAKAGTVAGCKHKTLGYVFLSVDYHKALAHRLAFLHVEGRWPDDVVDHINGDRADNRWCNLRVATRKLNAENQRKPRSTNKTGLLGVTKIGKRFQAAISIGGKQVKLGYFDSPDLAAAAYVAAKRIHHAGCTI